ncbi:MAG: hypothetical protein ORN54_11780 [Cyclobacteriaceae bacterium]|nr:hypothetical protein [Cyclobacteriaceae bacterium]
MFLLIALVLEGLGLIAILWNNNIPTSYAVSGILFAIALDVAIAGWHHSLVSGKTTELEAKILLALEKMGDFEKDGLNERNITASDCVAAIKSRKRWSYIPATLIILFCILKIVAYAGLKGFQADTVLLFVMVSYVVVAYIHLTRTGYVLSALIASFFWWRDVKKFEDENRKNKNSPKNNETNNTTNDDGKFTPYSFEIPTEVLKHMPKSLPSVYHNGNLVHDIIKSDDNNKPGEYVLRCRGVMLDSDVVRLLDPIANNDIKKAIGLRCSVHQLFKSLNTTSGVDK